MVDGDIHIVPVAQRATDLSEATQLTGELEFKPKSSPKTQFPLLIVLHKS